MQYFFFVFFIVTQMVFAELSFTKIITESLPHFNSEENMTKQEQLKVDVSGLKKINELPEKIEQQKVESLAKKNKEKALLEREAEEKRTLAFEKQKLEEEYKRKEAEKRERERKKAEALQKVLDELEVKKEQIDDYLSTNNIWTSLYYNYENYQRLSKKLHFYKSKIRKLRRQSKLTNLEKKEFEKLENQFNIIKGKLSQLDEYKKSPLPRLVKIPDMGPTPELTNPLDIITAMSFQKHLQNIKDENANRYTDLEEAVHKLKEKYLILKKLEKKTHGRKYNSYVDELKATEEKLLDFVEALAVFKTSVSTYTQEVAQANLKIDEAIEKEVKKSIKTGSIVLFLVVFFLFIKYLVNRYMSENDLFYSINKVVNFVFIALVFVIVLFSYLENVENLMTVLSFASAGIAIALKDWFMSLLGWFVILMSGSIHVGDRVKFVKDGVEYVGDIVDISILRMTLHEDVTLTTVFTNRRSGRMIFIPNNYVFTDMIANYSHSGLKTVWDGIDFFITFDSNVTKAQSIAKEVTRKYSKGYTDMTRKQLNRLRSKYSMRNTAVEPRILSFLDTYGVRVSAWYLTNAYATLTLRSTISMEILARLKEADDIFLAFPSQSLYMDKSAPKNIKNEDIIPNEKDR